ncbi:hypothetical protein JTL80_35055, partial [Pseudomonas aeruginosa]|nr:hypothetical protein [Pseudomonas aeruginosa]
FLFAQYGIHQYQLSTKNFTTSQMDAFSADMKCPTCSALARQPDEWRSELNHKPLNQFDFFFKSRATKALRADCQPGRTPASCKNPLHSFP